MPRPHPPEFRQRAVELAQLREQPLGKIAADLGISESCLRRWVRLSEGSSGGAAGRAGPDTAAVLDTSERAELIELRGRLDKALAERESIGSPACQSPMPPETTSTRSDSSASASIDDRTTSALGERQMLPEQMKATR